MNDKMSNKRTVENECNRDPPKTEDSAADFVDSGSQTGRTPASRYFRIVVQEREPRQMDVLRWLISDDAYECTFIRHDRDTRQTDVLGKDTPSEDTDPDEKSEEVGEDGRILPHYHMIIRTQKKVTAKTMFKRFGGYVYFQLCGDPYDSARYLTHECFRARHKYKYPRSDVKGNLEFYHELLNDAELRAFECVSDWSALMAENEHDHKKALTSAVKQGDKRLIKSIMSHSYFYKEFF